MARNPHRDRDELVDAVVARAQRRGGGVAMRNAFAQRGRQARPVPGPLHDLVRNHDERALDLYLLARAMISSDEVTGKWDVAFDARLWARGLGLPTAKDTGTAAVSKTWRRLEDHGLIERERRGRLANITLLDEAGTGREYTYPSGKGRGRYYKLSEKFWTADERWYRTLSLAAKAMLLVGSSLKPGFVLPLEQMPAWYGISPDTAARGLRELEDAELLEKTKRSRREPLSPNGYVIENVYELKSPFAQDWRTRKLASVTSIHGDEDAEGA